MRHDILVIENTNQKRGTEASHLHNNKDPPNNQEKEKKHSKKGQRSKKIKQRKIKREKEGIFNRTTPKSRSPT